MSRWRAFHSADDSKLRKSGVVNANVCSQTTRACWKGYFFPPNIVIRDGATKMVLSFTIWSTLNPKVISNEETITVTFLLPSVFLTFQTFIVVLKKTLWTVLVSFFSFFASSVKHIVSKSGVLFYISLCTYVCVSLFVHYFNWTRFLRTPLWR